MPFQIACQTITFGPDQYQQFPAVFAAVRQAGYTGVETGYRHLANFSAEQVRQMLSEAGLALAASHIGGNLDDAGQADSERDMLDEILDYLNALEATRLCYSGPQYQDDEQYAAFIDMLGRAAERCQERGVQLLYHNHWWEFAHNWKPMNMILERAPQSLGFCPDIGWVYKGQADVLEFLEKVRDRLGAVHYKDFTTHDADAKDFCILGEGVTPFEETTVWLRAHAPDLWVIAEQDKADVAAEEAVTRNADYLKQTVLTR